MIEAERQHVEQDGDEDEDDRRAAAARRRSAGACRRLLAHDGRFRLCAKGLAFSRSVIRTGVPGRSNSSRSELTR